MKPLDRCTPGLFCFLVFLVCCNHPSPPQKTSVEVKEVLVEPVEEPSSAVFVDPALGLALEEARQEVFVSRAFASPPVWLCDAAARRKKKKRLRAWSDVQALNSLPHLLEEGLLPKQDKKSWQNLRWLYVKKGVCFPEEFLRGGAVSFTLMGHSVRTHPALAVRLRKVDRALYSPSFEVPFAWAGSLSPRTVRGPFKKQPSRLSNHALGMAIDFEPAANPYLARAELALIREITGIKLPRKASLSAGKRWDIYDKANTLFMERAEQWYDDTPLEVARLKKRGARSRARRLQKHYQTFTTSENLRRASQQGFLGLPRRFVVTMEEAGLTWATDFKAGADLMHFELRPVKLHALTRP